MSEYTVATVEITHITDSDYGGGYTADVLDRNGDWYAQAQSRSLKSTYDYAYDYVRSLAENGEPGENEALRGALASVRNEIKRQIKLKNEGRFKHTPTDPEMTDDEFLRVIVEEVGEVARAIHEGESQSDLYEEITQIAAIAVARLMYYKNKWHMSRVDYSSSTYLPDRMVALGLAHSRSAARGLIAMGKVYINGSSVPVSAYDIDEDIQSIAVDLEHESS